MAEIAEKVALERAASKATTWSALFRWPILKVTMLGTGVQCFQQITGTNSKQNNLQHPP